MGIKFLKEMNDFKYDHKEITDRKEGGPFIVTGILQRADAVNQNGRIYPREVLEPQIELYKELVRERRALGECVDIDTEILTNDGWKFIKDINDNEIVATLCPKTNKIEYHQIDEKIVLPYKGKMYHFKNNKKLDMLLTPKHKMVFWDRNGKYYKLTAEQTLKLNKEKDHELTNSVIKNSGIWPNKEYEKYEISETDIVFDNESTIVETVDYDGLVYCVRVTNNNWLMRRNGKVAWTGNCDHADDPVVNLKHVSHVVTDIWMENDGVVKGKVEILPTPMGQILKTLFESNIKVGISSRALGSVISSPEGDIVQDDLHFICWDFVSEPSTSGAWMLKESREYTREEVKKIIGKQERINQAVTELLNFHKKIKNK